jgi:hypothetical protein
MGLIWIVIAAVVVIAAATAFRALRKPVDDVVAAPPPPPKAPPPPGGDKRWDIAPAGVSAGRYAADITRNAQIGALAEWLVKRASRDTGIDLTTDPMAVTRIAEAAGKAWPELQAQGRARITLPYIAASRDGPKHIDLTVDSGTPLEGMMEVWLVAGVAVVAAVVVFALLNRRSGQVIDAPRQAQPTLSAPTEVANDEDPTDDGDPTAGDLLKAEGGDEPLEAFADWLENEASQEFDDAVFEPGPTRRIADAARAAMPVIPAQGRGVVDLPGLMVDATGGRDFRREIDIARLERAVADFGAFDAFQLAEWRKDPERVKALAAWLENEVTDDMPDDATEMAEDDTVRIVEAARRGVLDIEQTGRADIALPAIGTDSKGQPFDTRRSVDAKELERMVEVERQTTRTYTRTRVASDEEEGS